MVLKIDTGFDRPSPKSAIVEPTMGIDFSDGSRAERTSRQIIEAIECFEDAEDLDKYVLEENLIIDSIYINFPEYAAAITDAHENHRIMLTSASANPRPAAPDNTGAPVTAQSQSKETRKMFTIDTGDTGGSLGPWISWTSNGSAMKGFNPETWILRGKNADTNEKTEAMHPAFVNGCVMDIDSLKLGWEKDGAAGQAPERKWNPSISQSTPRPDDSTKASGGFAWSRALSVRCAIGGGEAATWEQGSWGAYSAFEKLASLITAQHPGDNTLPLVVQTGVERQTMAKGTSAIPIFSISKWVPRPDCLKADAPVIATAPVAAPAPAPAPQAAAPATVPADADF